MRDFQMNQHCDFHRAFVTFESKSAKRFDILPRVCRPEASKKLHVSQTHNFGQQNLHNPAFFFPGDILRRAFLMVQAARAGGTGINTGRVFVARLCEYHSALTHTSHLLCASSEYEL